MGHRGRFLVSYSKTRLRLHVDLGKGAASAFLFHHQFIGETSMPIKSVNDLFVHEISDTHNAEKQMTRSLPKLARASTDPELARAFEDHLQETRAQVDRLEQIAELCGFKIKRVKCDGMEGLVEETMSLVDLIEKGAVLDVALIGAAQKAEHYEIAGYTSLCLIAQKLGLADAIPLLKASLAEEQATDKRLGLLAEANQIAAAQS
jgi:ferritin-like metal-binding protein YciE